MIALNEKKMKRRLAAKLEKKFTLESKKKRTDSGHPVEKSHAYKSQLARARAWKAKKKAAAKLKGTPEKRTELVSKHMLKEGEVDYLVHYQVK